MREGFRRLVEQHGTIVCAGSGGVGKTTTAAAIGLWGAMTGRRTVVLTIDPARRLADSIGLPITGGGEVEIEPEWLRQRSIELRASLSAKMLDQKGAWDSLVERHASSPEVRDRIFANRFYQHLSESFAGSQDYMAVEELCALQESGRYDLIVVDTPPSKHALDFLQAPRRISDFLDRDVIRWFVTPMSAGWSTMRLMNRTAGFLFRKLEEATGVGVLSEISDFFASMSSIFENFGERLKRVERALQGSGTAFVLVSSPEELALEEAEYLTEQMRQLSMPLRGVVLNRVRPEFSGPVDRADFPDGEIRPDDTERVAEVLSRSGAADPDLARRLAHVFSDAQRVARGDGLRAEQFAAGLASGVPVVQVPNFSSDLHDLASIREMHPFLFEDDPA